MPVLPSAPPAVPPAEPPPAEEPASAPAPAASALAQRIDCADDVDALRQAATGLGSVLVGLVRAEQGPEPIGQTISALNDRLTLRLLTLAEARLGPPPVPYAWLACGSQGRREQTVHSDQDNALIVDDAFQPERHGDYFASLAALVNEGLDRCGFRYCAGEVMAGNARWRQSAAAWTENFRSWIEQPDRKSAMLVANFADLRVVAGPPDLLAPLHAVLHGSSPRSALFLAHLAANALANRPPARIAAWLRHVGRLLGQRAGSINLKRAGLLPISDLARVHALANGITENSTLARLRAAAGGRGLRLEAARRLEAAFCALGELRTRHQAAQIEAGRAPDNELDLATLSPAGRRQLEQALATVRLMQDSLRRHYPPPPDQ